MNCFARLIMWWIIGMLNSPLVAYNASTVADYYVVIVAGGKGERLWPHSRKDRPKQLIPVCGEKTLLEQTVERMQTLVTSKDHLWVLTTQDLASEIHKMLDDHVGTIIAEPLGRNTGPAIALCCLQLAQINPDAQVIFVPSDAFIPTQDNNMVLECARQALLCAQQNDAICLLGVQPTFPATGYGYIEYDHTRSIQNHSFKVRVFHEKPNQQTAEEYIKQNNMLWNLSMFAGPVARFIAEFKKHAPDILCGIERYLQHNQPYESIPSLSIDYAIIEKSNRIWVTPATFSWCDVGNVATFVSLKKQYNDSHSNHIFIDSNNNLIDVSDKLVALIDVDDLCVVQTDDTLLITKKDSAEKVRAIVSHLKEHKMDHYL